MKKIIFLAMVLAGCSDRLPSHVQELKEYEKLLSTLNLTNGTQVDASRIPKTGAECHFPGDTNKYVVVWVPDRELVTICLNTNTGKVYYETNVNGPFFIGVSPTNDFTKLVIVRWPQ
jgi:hypothetical protein